MNLNFIKNVTAITLLLLAAEFVDAQKNPPPIVKGKNVIVTVKSSEAPPDNLTPAQRRRVESFELAWSTLDTYYFDRTFNNLDWLEIKREYAPRVVAAKTDREFHILLQEMIARLDRSHLAVIPPEVYEAIETAKKNAKLRERQINERIAASDKPDAKDVADALELSLEENARYGIGIDLRLINDEFVVTEVEKKSAGEFAGLKTGFVLTKVNDVSLAELLLNIQISSPNNKNIRKSIPLEIVTYFLNGDKDTLVNVEYTDAAGQSKQLKIRRELLKGEAISIGKNYPEQYLRFVKKSLSDDVGYIKFNLFALSVIKDFCGALTELKTKKAIIIDLRGNLGGVLGTMVGLGGMLADQPIDLGTSYYKIGSENMSAMRKAKNYQGRIVVLVDNVTASAAEIFAAALKENNRALVVGEKTSGQALPSVSVDLATGAYLTYPIANYKTHQGNLIEGNGLTPDYTVALDKKTLLENNDAQFQKALDLIADDKAFINNQPIKIISAAQSPPPPPPPAKAPTGAIISAKPVEPEVKDEKSLKVIEDFFTKIGGRENLTKINAYHLRGATEIAVKGTNTSALIDVYVQKPDKYSQILETDAIGDVREIYNGRNGLLQTDYGLTTEFPVFDNALRADTLSPIFNLLDSDYFKSAKYLGMFVENGRKVNVVQLKTKEGTIYGLAFDNLTKLLVSTASRFSIINLDDYRKVGNVTMPFFIEREGVMTIKASAYEVNQPIAPENFTKKTNCFDTPD